MLLALTDHQFTNSSEVFWNYVHSLCPSSKSFFCTFSPIRVPHSSYQINQFLIVLRVSCQITQLRTHLASPTSKFSKYSISDYVPRYPEPLKHRKLQHSCINWYLTIITYTCWRLVWTSDDCIKSKHQILQTMVWLFTPSYTHQPQKTDTSWIHTLANQQPSRVVHKPYIL